MQLIFRGKVAFIELVFKFYDFCRHIDITNYHKIMPIN